MVSIHQLMCPVSSVSQPSTKTSRRQFLNLLLCCLCILRVWSWNECIDEHFLHIITRYTSRRCMFVCSDTERNKHGNSHLWPKLIKGKTSFCWQWLFAGSRLHCTDAYKNDNTDTYVCPRSYVVQRLLKLYPEISNACTALRTDSFLGIRKR